MSGIELSVVMFAFNEAENVRPVMVEALEYLRGRVERYELILVDDGSSDDTRVRADEVAAEDDSVKVISHRPAAAFNAGINEYSPRPSGR